MRRQGSLGSTIREKVSDILRLQDQPPKGQRQVDLLTQDIASLVGRNEWLARKRDSFVRSQQGRERERERLIGQDLDHDDVDDGGDGAQPDSDPFAGARAHHTQVDAHRHQPPPQHPAAGLRRSGSLNPKRSSSYNYPQPSPASGPVTRAEGGRRWSSFHHPHNSVSALQTHSAQFLHRDAHGWSDVRGSALDEEDDDAPDSHRDPHGYAQL
jgi:hypothetical protein